MNKRKNGARSLRLVASLAMLAAISIICGKYLAIRGGDILRFSFENLPIIFAGIAFGPVSAVLVAVVADLMGCLLVGYAINPIVTAGAAAIGLVSGASAQLFKKLKLPRLLSVSLSVASAHLVGSVIIKTLGLAKFYDMPLVALMLWRLLNYAIVGVLEALILYYLLRSKAIMQVINDVAPRKAAKSFSAFANSFQAVTVPGLGRIRALCDKLGNPERGLRFIHVAGTNGKGSVCADLASILVAAGYKTGKYISPNLIRVNERISVDGVEISDAELDDLLARIEPLAREVEGETGIAPTQFEIWTAAALLYFSHSACDYVVLEVGLGGELDATNVIPENELAIITRLGLDHTQYLGATLREVAAAKCGIIKAGGRAVISAPQEPEAMRVIRESAERAGVELFVAEPEARGAEGVYETFSIGGGRVYKCGIAGYHQVENAAVAVAAARRLGIGDECIAAGLAAARNPARFELIAAESTVIYDGGHNENGIAALTFSLKRYFGSVPKTVVFACMRDKEIEGSLRLLSEGDTKFVFTTVKNNPRAMSAADLQKKAAELGVRGEAFGDVGAAYRAAVALGRLTVICGSLYLYKDFREFYDGAIGAPRS